MKIAIIGQDFEAKKKIINKFMELCPTYGTPKETIYDNEVSIPEDVKLNEQWSPVEKELYKRMYFLVTQMDKYYDKENIVYLGHSLDILVETMKYNSIVQSGFLNMDDYVSDDFVEKMIYWNQKLMQKLDLIYWLPCSEKFFTEQEMEDFKKYGDTPYECYLDEAKSEDDLEKLFTERIDKWEDKWLDQQAEIIYNNIWNEYVSNFDKSEILPKDCPGMAFFETDRPGAEMAEIVQDLDTADLETQRMDDMAKLDKIIKDKKLLDMMKETLKQNTIPLPSGERITSGSISLDKPV